MAKTPEKKSIVELVDPHITIPQRRFLEITFGQSAESSAPIAMSISVSVALLSGRSKVISTSPESTVDELRLQAQLSLKVGLERLVTESGWLAAWGD